MRKYEEIKCINCNSCNSCNVLFCTACPSRLGPRVRKPARAQGSQDAGGQKGRRDREWVSPPVTGYRPILNIRICKVVRWSSW